MYDFCLNFQTFDFGAPVSAQFFLNVATIQMSGLIVADTIEFGLKIQGLVRIDVDFEVAGCKRNMIVLDLTDVIGFETIRC